MFLGTTSPIIGQYIKEMVVESGSKNVWALFSGNFCVEQFVAAAGGNRIIHSTDVSLYSRGVGFGLTNQEFDAVLKEEYIKEFPYVGSKNTPIEKAAQIIFFTEIMQNWDKAEKVEYYARLIEDAKKNEKIYYDKLLIKVRRTQEVLNGMKFYGENAALIKALSSLNIELRKSGMLEIVAVNPADCIAQRKNARYFTQEKLQQEAKAEKKKVVKKTEK